MDGSREDEYAEAFRRGYERAQRGFEETVRLERGEPAPQQGRPENAAEPRWGGSPAAEAEAEQGTERSQSFLDALWPTVVPTQHALERSGGRDESSPDTPPQATPPLPVHEGTSSRRDPRAGGDDHRRRRVVLVSGLVATAVLLVAGAFLLGRLLADGGSSSPEPEAARAASGGGESQAAPYDGAVSVVGVAASSATCQSGSSIDAAGNSISYEPAKAHDSDLSTAWRCDGSGKGERFTVALPDGTVVAEVGLVPGYAKTDPANGADRYAENNRITRVRWRLDDGSTYVQRMSGDAGNRSMRTMRIPATATGQVVIEILAAKPGPRNTVAISEIRIASPSID